MTSRQIICGENDDAILKIPWSLFFFKINFIITKVYKLKTSLFVHLCPCALSVGVFAVPVFVFNVSNIPNSSSTTLSFSPLPHDITRIQKSLGNKIRLLGLISSVCACTRSLQRAYFFDQGGRKGVEEKEQVRVKNNLVDCNQWGERRQGNCSLNAAPSIIRNRLSPSSSFQQQQNDLY